MFCSSRLQYSWTQTRNIQSVANAQTHKYSHKYTNFHIKFYYNFSFSLSSFFCCCCILSNFPFSLPYSVFLFLSSPFSYSALSLSPFQSLFLIPKCVATKLAIIFTRIIDAVVVVLIVVFITFLVLSFWMPRNSFFVFVFFFNFSSFQAEIPFKVRQRVFYLQKCLRGLAIHDQQ